MPLDVPFTFSKSYRKSKRLRSPTSSATYTGSPVFDMVFIDSIDMSGQGREIEIGTKLLPLRAISSRDVTASWDVART